MAAEAALELAAAPLQGGVGQVRRAPVGEEVCEGRELRQGAALHPLGRSTPAAEDPVHLRGDLVELLA